MALLLDTRYALQAQLPTSGIAEGELGTALEGLGSVYAQVQNQKKSGELGFAKLPYVEDLSAITELARAVRERFQTVVVIGIGGSDLGARAVHRALNHQFYNLRQKPQLFFLGDTTDPVAIQEVLDVADLPDTAFVVISKSGNTVEQMSTFVYVRQLLLEAVGAEASKEHFIILTDAEGGTLRDIVNKEGYRSLPVPGDVGGRFSVLSTVGLFPLAVAGIDIAGLLRGAREMDEADSARPSGENDMLRYAFLQHWNYQQGRPISVFMPYAYSLREVGFWFRQLWAESLGKAKDLQGKVVNVGPTPIAAVGPTDQHSQVQLYMEGPVDKLFTFVTVADPAVNMVLPEAFAEQEGVSYLKGHTFNEILQAEAKSTAYALAGQGRPSLTLTLERLDAQHLGQLLYFLEMATAYAGILFDINAFDQPGVEVGKKHMYAMLGRPGFEEWKIKE